MRHRRNNSHGRGSFGKGGISPSKEIPPPPPPLHSGTLPRTAKERLRHAEAGVRVCQSDNDKSDYEGRKLKRAQSENFKYFGPCASIREPELLQNQQNENRNCHSCKSLNKPVGQKLSKVRPGRPIPVSDRGVTTKKTTYLSDSSQLFLGQTACISTNPSYIPSSTSPTTQYLPASDSDDVNSNTPTDTTPTSLNSNYSNVNDGSKLSSHYIGERLAITHRSPMKRAGPGGARRLPSQLRRSPSPTKRKQSQGRQCSEVVINITKVS